jgi:hypothetical protein
MKKIVAVLLAVMVLSALAFAGVASAKASKDAGAVSFTLVAHSVTFEAIERGFTFTDSIETTDGEPVDGWDGGRCLNLNPDPEVITQYLCDIVFDLPEGVITAAGAFDLTAPSAVFAVTGGTGAFRNARGEIEVIPIDETASYAVFRLIGASANY